MASARGRGSLARGLVVLTGSGDMTRSTGLRISRWNTGKNGFGMPGNGYRILTPMAIWKCPEAGRRPLRWMGGGGIMRIILVQLRRMDWGMKKPSARYGSSNG